jgi:magnesium chelatase family protein
LAETVVKESKDRVRGAILSNHFDFPHGRVTVNLAPAELPKEGCRFDLPIAIGILAATGQLGAKLDLFQYELAGELSLGGALKSFQGVLPFILQAKQENKIVIMPESSVPQVGPVEIGKVYTASHLMDVILHLRKEKCLTPLDRQTAIPELLSGDFSEIKGQHTAKRALEISAAGGHNVILVGPPGSGKTLLASRLPSILPPLSEKEAVEVATLTEMRGQIIPSQRFFTPPFRSPHHSASSVALVGGGSKVTPGEISLAHRGVLFLDELPEFQRATLEMLREPLESGAITIARARHTITYPAEFQLIAAMNPCPCGYSGSRLKPCECTPPQIQRYRHKLSGPLLDRFDLSLFVSDLTPSELMQKTLHTENSTSIRQRVERVRALQLQRQGCLNHRLNHQRLQTHCPLTPHTEKFLIDAMEKKKCSARALTRIVRLARTVADLAQAENIQDQHVAEVLQMRHLG